ncbi:beta/gamma crystallin domain-containing protein [Psychromicrobium sp. YIM B11713]|uniref:beta/gamma crystallin domain-containing protein n=1 Tax=Psychromicrobium sp. YIM B11713 TaxID=3145233 RepID=UPI00374E305F
MAFDFKKVARKTLVASVVAGSVLVAVPAVAAPTASANEVGCTDPYFVELYWHTSSGIHGNSCYANKSYNPTNDVWADRIDTGNNDVNYYDVNGAVVYIPRLTTRTWPSGQPHIRGIEIL